MDWIGCQGCPLSSASGLTSPRMMPTVEDAVGDLGRPIFILGEGPGGDEDAEGHQFVGRAGQYLRRHLPPYRPQSIWDNCVRCRPTLAEHSRWGVSVKNRPPSDDELRCCATHTSIFLHATEPVAILGLGNIPLRWAWGEGKFGRVPKITAIRGLWLPVTEAAVPFFAAFHPSHAMRAEEEANDPDDPVCVTFRTDLARFFTAVSTGQIPQFPVIPKPYDAGIEIIIPDTIEQVMLALYRTFPHDTIVAVDIETLTLKPAQPKAAVRSFAVSNGVNTLSVVLTHVHERGALEVLCRFLVEGERQWIAHNAQFELLWFLARAGEAAEPLRSNFIDTMLWTRVVHGRAPDPDTRQQTSTMGLGLASRIELGIEVKALSPVDALRLSEYSDQEVGLYNAYDAKFTFPLYQALQSHPLTNGMRAELQALHETVPALTHMELVGLPADVQCLTVLEAELTKSAKECEIEAFALPEVQKVLPMVQTKASLTSPRFIAQVLEEGYGCRLPHRGKTDQGSTGEEILTELARKGNRLATLVIRHRQQDKLRRTYIWPFTAGGELYNGRIYPGYSPVFTASGRFSSQNPNIQNFPKRRDKRIRAMITASPGCVFLGADYSGLEARVIAMRTKDPVLQQEILTGIDTHGRWSQEVLNRWPAYADHCLREADLEDANLSDAEVFDTVRSAIKNDMVFALFYGSEAIACGRRMGIPEQIMREIEAKFWGDYCNVKQKIDADEAEYRRLGYVTLETGRTRDGPLSRNQIANTPVQGVAADLVRDALCRLFWKAVETECWELAPRIDIHDELIFEVEEEHLEEVTEIVTQEMVTPAFPFVTVPLAVKVTVGPNWAYMEKAGEVVGKVWGAV